MHVPDRAGCIINRNTKTPTIRRYYHHLWVRNHLESMKMAIRKCHLQSSAVSANALVLTGDRNSQIAIMIFKTVRVAASMHHGNQGKNLVLNISKDQLSTMNASSAVFESYELLLGLSWYSNIPK
ncbi:AAEL008012-PA [Aedes aegypti]|uniref:AAEL008012-PA n=1 Tax=Aedes aegypti TaxID=7159 RepID=Q16ZZ5_AEDAE|nr:AAEL008012-PA [Aedes aegypti]